MSGLLLLAAGTLTTHAGLLYPATAAPSANHLYIASSNSSRIQKFTPAGDRSEVASGDLGNIVPTPSGMAFDSAGNLFVMSITSNQIQKVTPDGVRTVFANTLNAKNYPSGLAFDSAGNLYSANYIGSVIQKFTPDGVGSVFATGGLLGGPTGLAFDAAGNLFVSNINGSIVKFTPGGVGSIFPTGGLLSQPMGLAFDNAGNLFVANLNNSRIIKFTPAGVGSIFASTGSIRPYGLAFDSSGNLFTGGSNPWATPLAWDYAVMKFTPDGVGSIFNAGGTANGLEDCKGFAFGPANADALNAPPIASAGIDFSVNEGQLAVALDGSGSSDPDNDPLTYEWVQVGGTTVALTGATTASPTFTAPVVPLGGETLSFDLTVTANGEASVDTVSVTVVNVNHPPVADAGIDQTLANANAVAEGSPVTLHGEDSFDIDNDVIDFAWTQVSGPAVTLTGANTANPTFDAPYFEAGGAAGVVATLTFELLVDDGFPADAPAEGYTLDNVRDTVTIEITNTNNLPVASAGPDQTVDENTSVALNGSLSSDPDTDALTYAWTQVAGPAVVLDDATSASPAFTAPFVNAGGADFEFQLSVDDGYGGSSTDNVVIHVQNANDPPLAAAAQPTIAVLWPPNHQMVAVGITGVSDPDNNAIIVITSVTQDEPTNGCGDGDTAIDAIIDGDTVLLRAERSGKGDGRVYHIYFTASDLEGSSSGVVTVTVPSSKKKPAIDSGTAFDSTVSTPRNHHDDDADKKDDRDKDEHGEKNDHDKDEHGEKNDHDKDSKKDKKNDRDEHGEKDNKGKDKKDK